MTPPTQTTSELGDFLLVLRRAMLMVCAYIAKRYGVEEPKAIHGDGKKRAA